MDLDEVIEKEQKSIEANLARLTNRGLNTLQALGDSLVKKYPELDEFCICNGSTWFTTILELKGNFGSNDIHSFYAGHYNLFLLDWSCGREDSDVPPTWVMPFLDDYHKINMFADFLDQSRLM